MLNATHGERNTPCQSTARSYPRIVAAAVDELTLSQIPNQDGAGINTQWGSSVSEAGVDWRAWPFTWHKLKAKVNKCSILVSYRVEITEAQRRYF